MSLINRLFANQSNKRKTGVYKVENQNLIELDELPGNGSINAIKAGLGYNNSQVKTILTFDSKTIHCIGVKIFTKEPIFVLTEGGVSNLKKSTLNSELNNIDWKSTYSSTEIESILFDGIESHDLTSNFLASVTKLEKKTDEIFLAPDLELFLHFKNNILIKINSSDGFSAESKWLRELNLSFFNGILEEAKQFQNSEIDAINEVNNQCIALCSIPNAMNNEYLEDHRNRFGNYNFYNLWAAHYSPAFKIEDFLQTNKGRFIRLNKREIKVNEYIYRFDDDGILCNSRKE